MMRAARSPRPTTVPTTIPPITTDDIFVVPPLLAVLADAEGVDEKVDVGCVLEVGRGAPEDSMPLTEKARLILNLS